MFTSVRIAGGPALDFKLFKVLLLVLYVLSLFCFVLFYLCLFSVVLFVSLVR